MNLQTYELSGDNLIVNFTFDTAFFMGYECWHYLQIRVGAVLL